MIRGVLPSELFFQAVRTPSSFSTSRDGSEVALMREPKVYANVAESAWLVRALLACRWHLWVVNAIHLVVDVSARAFFPKVYVELKTPS